MDKTNSQIAIDNLTKKGYINDSTLSWVTKDNPELAKELTGDLGVVVDGDWTGTGYDKAEADSLTEAYANDFQNKLDYTAQKYAEWDPSNTSADHLYSGDKNLAIAPKIDTSNVTDMSSMFYGCSIGTVPQFDTSKVTDMSSMFDGCSSLKEVPQFDTKNVTNMSGMFYGCSIGTVPQFDTSNVTDMNSMFSSCSIGTVPLFDTKNVTNMFGMFNSCSKLTSVPQFDTKNVTNMESMFNSCSKLTSVPLFDTKNVTNMESMFNSCSSLTSVPLFDTSSVTNMKSMFSSCSSLTLVPRLNATSITRIWGNSGMSNIFGGVYSAWCESLTDLGGFTDLKQDLDVSGCVALTEESLNKVIKEVANLTELGLGSKTLKLGQVNLAKLEPEEIAVGTNKGWNIIA